MKNAIVAACNTEKIRKAKTFLFWGLGVQAATTVCLVQKELIFLAFSVAGTACIPNPDFLAGTITFRQLAYAKSLLFLQLVLVAANAKNIVPKISQSAK